MTLSSFVFILFLYTFNCMQQEMMKPWLYFLLLFLNTKLMVQHHSSIEMLLLCSLLRVMCNLWNWIFTCRFAAFLFKHRVPYLPLCSNHVGLQCSALHHGAGLPRCSEVSMVYADSDRSATDLSMVLFSGLLLSYPMEGIFHSSAFELIWVTSILCMRVWWMAHVYSV